MRRIIRWLMLVVLMLPGCTNSRVVRPGATQSLSESVPLDDAQRVNVRLQNGISDLTVQGGAAGLVEGDFQYNLEELKPVVTYGLTDTVGTLAITHIQEQTNFVPAGEIVSTWDLRFNEKVPLLITANVGLGTSKLDLSSLIVEGLTVQGGAGDLEVRVGSQKIDAVRVNAGLGKVLLQMNGAIPQLTFQGGAGDATLDLSGEWTSNLAGQLGMGLGSTTLSFPNDVGVQVVLTPGPGAIIAPGFTKSGNTYTNDLYGQAEIRFDLKVTGGLGNLTLQMVE